MAHAPPLPISRGRAPVIAALAVIVAVVTVDILIASDRVAVTSLMIAAPLLCGVTSSSTTTLRIGALSVLAAALAFLWGPTVSTSRYWIGLGVVTVGSIFAAVMARYRGDAERDAGRIRVLADVAEIAHGGQQAQEIARAVVDVLVPRVVDLCAIDVVGPGGMLRRLAGAAAGAPDHSRELLGRTLRAGGEAQLPAATEHQPMLSAGDARRLGRDDEERRLLGELGIESAITVLLAPRGAPLGALVLGTRSPRPRLSRPDDVEYAETLAGRVGLALDNAVLSAELTSAEQQLHVILGAVDAAVTVRDRHGRMVYANQAAANLLKLPDPAAVLAYAPGGLMARFDVYTEDGEPVDITGLAGTRLLMGESAPDAMVVRNVVKATGEERWLLNKATGVVSPEGEILMAVNLIEDITETKRHEIAQRLMAETLRTLAETPDLTSTLQAIADAAVPSLADWASVNMVDESGEIRMLAIAHRDPEKVRQGWYLNQRWPTDHDESRGLASVIRTGEPLLVREITEEMLTHRAQDPEHLGILREVGLNSAMIAPIRSGERILGALSFVSCTSRRFDERDLELASDLGRQAGVIVDSAELQAAQSHIAQTLQAGLIPRTLPAVEGWKLSSAYRAAGRGVEVGGDFYDLVTFDGGWAAIIGDVVGKGAEAAALTALARHTLAAIVASTGNVAHAFQVLNRRLRERSDDYRSLCTVAAVVVSGEDQVTILSAGHPLPVLRRGVAAWPVGRPGPMLGYVDDVELQNTPVAVDLGDQLILYTDGVLDAIGASGRFGETRLLETVRSLGDGMAAAHRILGAIDGFRDSDHGDDIAILSLARIPVPAARPAS
ncbi:MAG TPA: SpoIIE family protein phosphatase [Solirubrobacteraceae bacterium]|nr:SpoIIE family protein phosphatase [Solirubrobacteraceae bacterium]